jgi:hypothetical protein
MNEAASESEEQHRGGFLRPGQPANRDRFDQSLIRVTPSIP